MQWWGRLSVEARFSFLAVLIAVLALPPAWLALLPRDSPSVHNTLSVESSGISSLPPVQARQRLRVSPPVVIGSGSFTVLGEGFNPSRLVTLRFFTGGSNFPVQGGEGIPVSGDGTFTRTLNPPVVAAQCGMQGEILAFDTSGDWSNRQPVAATEVAFACSP